MHKTLLVSLVLVCIVCGDKEPEAKASSIHQHEHPQERHLHDVYAESEESRIVQDVYSPDYYEPNIILDYRYLKTGGRKYTRSDGGQVLVLPRNNELAIEYNDYDSLLEYLRHKRLAELHKIYQDSRRIHRNGFEQHLDTIPGLYETIEGPHGYEQYPKKVK